MEIIILSTKKDKLEKNRDLLYYCVNHRITETKENIYNKAIKKGFNYVIIECTMIKIEIFTNYYKIIQKNVIIL